MHEQDPPNVCFFTMYFRQKFSLFNLQKLQFILFIWIQTTRCLAFTSGLNPKKTKKKLARKGFSSGWKKVIFFLIYRWEKEKTAWMRIKGSSSIYLKNNQRKGWSKQRHLRWGKTNTYFNWQEVEEVFLLKRMNLCCKRPKTFDRFLSSLNGYGYR